MILPEEAKYWKCKRCGYIVDMVNKRCGCAVSPSPWEPISELEYEITKECEKIWEKTKYPDGSDWFTCNFEME